MLRVSVSLAAGALLLTFGSFSARALPTDGLRVGHASESLVETVQSTSRCFRRCIAGKRYRSCQRDADGKEACCSRRCSPRR